MNKIIKIGLVGIVLLFTTSAIAQVKMGVRGGVNVSSFGGDIERPKSIVGFQAGLTLDVRITEMFSVQTGIDYILKASKHDQTGKFAGITGTITQENTPQYLQVPLHLAVKLPLGETTRVVIRAGPYAAYGIAGNIKYSGSFEGGGIAGSADLSKTDFFSDNTYRKIDYGIGGGVGFETGIIAINVGYDYGLANINQKKNDDKTRVQSLFATIGVVF